MKFGNNLQHLSIPEWKSYNLDYNELKYQIRSITQQTAGTNKNSNLSNLRQSFIDNFDYINLFIHTKYGELLRKNDYYEVYFHRLLNKQPSLPDDEVIRHILIELDEIFYQIIELSIELKKLSKFILIQKIAIKKIFKKFLKYYTKKNGTKFVIELKEYLTSNPNSVINFDLCSLTLKVTNFINLIKYERKRYNNLFTSTRPFHLDRKLSLFSISSTLAGESQYQSSVIAPSYRRNNSTVGCASITSSHHRSHSKQLHYENRPIPHVQQDPISLESHFDLAIYIKKNFKLHALTPLDSNTLNELMLNFNIYLNLKSISDVSGDYVSYIYLTHDNLSLEHATIMSTTNNDHSIIVANIGDLRKYGYCVLPNKIVQLLLNHLSDKLDEETKQQLIEYFKENDSSPLTKKTIDYIVSHNLKPTLRRFCKRLRYIVDGEDRNEMDEENPQSAYASVEEADDNDNDDDQRSIISSCSDNKYFIALDSEISTTNDKSHVKTVKFPKSYDAFDFFPHNHLAIYSNDEKLSNFEHSLETEIDIKDGLIKNKYGSTRKLPRKIQSILNNKSVSLFKGLDFYQYQLSCYHNIIPNGQYINNHYTNLLNLNLLKNFEDIDGLNQQQHEENTLITKKSHKIIQHKMSMKTMSSTMDAFNHSQNLNSLGSSTHSIFDTHVRENEEEDEGSISPSEEVQINDDLHVNGGDNEASAREYDDNEADEDEDDYGIYLRIDDNNTHSPPLTNFIYTVLNFKDRFFKRNKTPKMKPLRQPNPIKKRVFENPFFANEEEEDYLDPYTKLLSYSYSRNFNNSAGGGYDSINEEPPTFLQRNQYRMRYQHQYDQTLSYIYFSLNIISLFLSGIQGGIIYSLFASTPKSQFLISNNVGLMIVLILGIALSLVFSIVSINLMNYRFTSPPLAHVWLVWSGFVMVVCCCIWSGLLVLF